ncbi:MmcQ/YjbR family DNA-binding protein [Phenylobacterium sp. LjRoot219]|uniref:MmcQ/YjbR family DNA-binding protein n=1 Tax=Phenylobacterium sp. LjRoot219 TaxID=3342283 RepID=UPI003ECE52F1
MTAEQFHAVVMAFPGVEEGTSYGHPAYKVAVKFFTRLRAEDLSVVLQEVGFDEREMLIAAAPATFHFTDHYRNYPIVLARIAQIEGDELRSFLERRWRKIAPKAAVKAWDVAHAGEA